MPQFCSLFFFFPSIPGSPKYNGSQNGLLIMSSSGSPDSKEASDDT